MNNYRKLGFVGLTCSALLVAGIAPAIAADGSAPEVDKCVANLAYDPVLTLNQPGEGVSNLPPTSGTWKDGEYTVVTREKKEINNSQGDFNASGLNAGDIYPGSLVNVDSKLLDNKPTVLAVPRSGKVTISADLPGNYQSYAEVDNANGATVNKSIAGILDNWNTSAAKQYKNQAARLVFKENMIHSQQQFEAEFHANFKVKMVDLGIDFNAIAKGEKQLYVASLRQVFYTVSAVPPTHASDWVANGGASVLCNGKNVPGYISSVDYGRQIYVFAQTSNKSTDVKAAFSAALKDQKGGLSGKYAKIVNDSDIKAVVFGGSAAEHVKVASGNIDQIRAVINEGATYGSANPAVPVAYTVKYLKDNSYATSRTIGAYWQTSVKTYKRGRLIINHKGGYVAQYRVSWDEITGFDKAGNAIKEHKEWEGNWHGRTSGAQDQIVLPANARNINVFVREATGLAWDYWRTVVDERDLALVPVRTVNVWGTTLNPQHNMEVQE